MHKQFWDDPYQVSLETEVSSVDGNRILFKDTIVFSFSGGQESDKASVSGLPVLDSMIEKDLIYYFLPENHGLSIGDKVTMEIDWARRYSLMRLHFATELILEIITRKWNFEKIGSHIAESKARIDFILDQNFSQFFEPILKDYNSIIEQDLPIIKGFADRETQHRFWKIDGFAQVSCGGTHVNSTGEVGLVILKRVNIGGGKERIEIKLMQA